MTLKGIRFVFLQWHIQISSLHLNVITEYSGIPRSLKGCFLHMLVHMCRATGCLVSLRMLFSLLGLHLSHSPVSLRIAPYTCLAAWSALKILTKLCGSGEKEAPTTIRGFNWCSGHWIYDPALWLFPAEQKEATWRGSRLSYGHTLLLIFSIISYLSDITTHYLIIYIFSWLVLKRPTGSKWMTICIALDRGFSQLVTQESLLRSHHLQRAHLSTQKDTLLLVAFCPGKGLWNLMKDL